MALPTMQCAWSGHALLPLLRRMSWEERGWRPSIPGEILQEEFLKPMGISQYRVAAATGVPPRRINEIVHGKRAITADTALRLSRYFGTSESF